MSFNTIRVLNRAFRFYWLTSNKNIRCKSLTELIRLFSIRLEAFAATKCNKMFSGDKPRQNGILVQRFRDILCLRNQGMCLWWWRQTWRRLKMPSKKPKDTTLEFWVRIGKALGCHWARCSQTDTRASRRHKTRHFYHTCFRGVIEL